MAELGSHQLDAASIFISAMHGGEKQHPLSVIAAADRPVFPADRDIEDHVFCVIEFPAPGYDPEDPMASRKKIAVQYASINGNGFGGYGEIVFGTKGTLILEREQEADAAARAGGRQLDQGERRGGRARPWTRRPAARRSRRRRPAGKERRSAAAMPRSWSIGPGASATRPRRTGPAAIPRWPWATP